MNQLDVIRYFESHQVPYRIQDGRILVLDSSQLPQTFRRLLDPNGYLGGGTTKVIQCLQDDPDPTLGGDLNLNNHGIVGRIETETLEIDGGLL